MHRVNASSKKTVIFIKLILNILTNIFIN